MRLINDPYRVRVELNLADQKLDEADSIKFRWEHVVSGTAEQILKIARGSDLFMAVGDRGIVLRSREGKTWEKLNAGTEERLRAVAYGNGTWVIGGSWWKSPHVLLVSKDEGETWQETVARNHYGITTIVHDGSRFVAVTFQGYIMTSPDGKTWTDFSKATGATLFDIAQGEGEFAAAGYKGRIGESGSLRGPWLTRVPDKHTRYAACFGCDRFIIAGGGGSIWFCRSGTDKWMKANSKIDHTINDMIRVNDRFIAVGNNGTILTSLTGLSWRPVKSGTSANLQGICHYGNCYFITGSNGLILKGIEAKQN